MESAAMLELGEFFGESGGEDGEAAPGFGVKILVVDVEGDGVAFAFPLVAAPKFVEFFGPVSVFFERVFWVDGLDDFAGISGAFFVADGGAFEGVKNLVGHEVGLIGLLLLLRAEFSGGILDVDVGKGGDGGRFGQAFGFHPAEPLAEIVFVDPGDGAEASGGVTIHGGVADGRFGAVAGGEEKGVTNVSKHPDAGGANAGLDVLAGDVVFLPGELSAEHGFNCIFVAFDEVVDFPLRVVAV